GVREIRPARAADRRPAKSGSFFCFFVSWGSPPGFVISSWRGYVRAQLREHPTPTTWRGRNFAKIMKADRPHNLEQIVPRFGKAAEMCSPADFTDRLKSRLPKVLLSLQPSRAHSLAVVSPRPSPNSARRPSTIYSGEHGSK